MVMLEQIRTVNQSELTKYIGFVDSEYLQKRINVGLKKVLGFWVERPPKRKNDIVVMAAYLFFEFYVVNYRPVLINGFLEASYPSSTTLLVMCVMPTAVMQLNSRIRNTKMKRAFAFALIAFTAFMVIGRLISGVHWITDIIGGAILSAGLVMIYYSVTTLIARQER